jgi:hypothetical protein
MRLRIPRHLRHLTLPFVLLSATDALVGTTGVLAGATSLPLGATNACGCGAANFSITPSTENPKGRSTITFKIKNISGHKAKVIGITFFPASHPEFIQNNTQVLNCETSYEPAEEHSFTVEYEGKNAASLEAKVEDENNKVARATVNGTS